MSSRNVRNAANNKMLKKNRADRYAFIKTRGDRRLNSQIGYLFKMGKLVFDNF